MTTTRCDSCQATRDIARFRLLADVPDMSRSRGSIVALCRGCYVLAPELVCALDDAI